MRRPDRVLSAQESVTVPNWSPLSVAICSVFSRQYGTARQTIPRSDELEFLALLQTIKAGLLYVTFVTKH
jgi:hypothetical protein